MVEPAAAMASIDYVLPAPPALAWEYLTSPARRLRWQAGVTDIVEQAAGGRRGVGTTNHCVHGKDAIVEEVLDWRPPEYFTINWQMPIPGAPKIKSTYQLTAVDAGTSVEFRMERPRSAKDRAFLEGVLPGITPAFEAGIAALGPLLADEMARRASEDLPEAHVPVSAGRFLEPVDSAAVHSS